MQLNLSQKHSTVVPTTYIKFKKYPKLNKQLNINSSPWNFATALYYYNNSC